MKRTGYCPRCNLPAASQPPSPSCPPVASRCMPAVIARGGQMEVTSRVTSIRTTGLMELCAPLRQDDEPTPVGEQDKHEHRDQGQLVVPAQPVLAPEAGLPDEDLLLDR